MRTNQNLVTGVSALEHEQTRGGLCLGTFPQLPASHPQIDTGEYIIITHNQCSQTSSGSGPVLAESHPGKGEVTSCECHTEMHIFTSYTNNHGGGPLTCSEI